LIEAMKKLLFLLLLFPLLAQAQLNPDYDYRKEFIWGPFKSSNGGVIGGLSFKKSIIKDDRIFHTFGLDIANVKHPKEHRYPSIQGSTFIFGKTNYLYTMRLRYGQEVVLFLKDTQQGVQINVGAGAGPSFAFVAPYFIQDANFDFVKYNPNVHTNPAFIAGPGKLFQGLGQSETVLGLNGRANITFEFGAFKNSVAGLEIGLIFDLYGKEIVLVPTQDNRSFYPAGFIQLFWGRRK
jgi:hypothetical protein